MVTYFIRRMLYMIPMIFLITIISFVIIELPPGDYLTMYQMELESRGQKISEEQLARLERRYGLNQSIHVRYFKWIKNIVLNWNFGRSFQYNRAVIKLIGERLGLTIIISLLTFIFTWIVAIPIGIYSAVKQYTIFDYIFTFFGFIGVSMPNFLLALILIYLSLVYFEIPITGLFSPEYVTEPWSYAKFMNMLKRIWVPIIVVGTAGTAGIIRVMRGCLLDELQKEYVTTARARGLKEAVLLFKYPVRLAINPLMSTIGWLLPNIISGSAITAIVLNLPTTGPLLLSALQSQDMYLAGGIILLLSCLVIIGTLISDILLALVDPRIRYE